MTILHSNMPPAAGFPQRETHIPKPRARRAARAAPPVNPETKPKAHLFIPVRDFEDEDWICCRSID